MSDKESLKPVLEAIIFAAEAPISVEKLASLLDVEEKKTVKEAVEELVEDYRSSARGLYIDEVAGGYQFRTRHEYAPWLRKLFKIGMQKVSKAAMESLAIIAYKQPLTRGELEAIRGVDSGGVLATLMEKRFVKIVGRKEVPGRPVVYGTTKEFLEAFDLRDLSCLPSLKDIQLMEEENAAQREERTSEDSVKEAVQDAGGLNAEGQGAVQGDVPAEASGQGSATGERPAEGEASGQADGEGAAEGEDAAADGGDPGLPDGKASEDNLGGGDNVEEEG